MSIFIFGVMSGHLPFAPAASAESQRLVSVFADGEKRVFATESGTVADILKRAGVTLGKHDLVEPALDTDVMKGFFNVNVYRARPVMIVDGENTYHLISASQSPRLLSELAGLKIYPEDDFTMEMISDIAVDQAVGVKITVIRSLPFTVRADGKTVQYRTLAKTVGAALESAKVAIGPKDTVVPAAAAPFVSGMSIKITRVTQVEMTLTNKRPKAVRTIQDDNMLRGTKKVQQEGSDGYTTADYRMHYRDGALVKKELLRVVKSVNPVERVEVVGTKVPYYGPADRARLMSNAGISDKDFGYVDYIIDHESGWVVDRYNYGGSGAYGLGQALPAGKMAPYGADYMTNPLTQLKWANAYAKNRYGSWAAAYDYWRAHRNW